jgi:hypothetical protein
MLRSKAQNDFFIPVKNVFIFNRKRLVLRPWQFQSRFLVRVPMKDRKRYPAIGFTSLRLVPGKQTAVN